MSCTPICVTFILAATQQSSATFNLLSENAAPVLSFINTHIAKEAYIGIGSSPFGHQSIIQVCKPAHPTNLTHYVSPYSAYIWSSTQQSSATFNLLSENAAPVLFFEYFKFVLVTFGVSLYECGSMQIDGICNIMASYYIFFCGQPIILDTSLRALDLFETVRQSATNTLLFENHPAAILLLGFKTHCFDLFVFVFGATMISLCHFGYLQTYRKTNMASIRM